MPALNSNRSIASYLTRYRDASASFLRAEVRLRAQSVCLTLCALALVLARTFRLSSFLSLTSAIVLSAFVYWVLLRRSRRAVPSLYRLAARLEQTDLTRGALTSALELEEEPIGEPDSPELVELTIALARDRIESAIVPLERAPFRALVYLGRPSGEADRARYARSQARWRIARAVSAAAFLFSCGYGAAVFLTPSASDTPSCSSPSNLAETSQGADAAFENAPGPSAPVLTRDSDSDVGSANDDPPNANGVLAALEAYAASAARAEILAREMTQEPLTDDLTSAFQLERELSRAIDDPTEGVFTRARQTRVLTAELLRSYGADASYASYASGRAVAAFLLARRLDAAVSEFERLAPARRDALDALGELRRRPNVKTRENAKNAIAKTYGELKNLTAEESSSASILIQSWRFGRELDLLEEDRTRLYEQCVRTLAARPGASSWNFELDPAELDETARFVQAAQNVKQTFDELEDLRAELLETLADENNRRFVQFVSDAADAAGVDGVVFDLRSNARASRMRAFVRGACDSAASQALEERWGRAAAALSRRFDLLVQTDETLTREADVHESQTPRDRNVELSIALTWGTPSERAKTSNVDDEIARESRSRPAFNVDSASDAVADQDASDASEDRERSRTSAEALGSIDEEADFAQKSGDLTARGDRAIGALYDAGGVPDARYSGAPGRTDASSADNFTNSRAFLPDVPPALNERIEAAKKWTPPPNARVKTTLFREKIEELAASGK